VVTARRQLTQSQWGELSRLAADTDLSSLPRVIGCPDCEDGGEESLLIVSDDASRTVSFDFGATIPEAQPLLERLRLLRMQMAPRS
jgi:hypothetical protein